MVRVKTPSGWKTVPSGTDVSVYGGGGSSSSGYKTGTVGSTTLYYITDPKTGHVTVTGSPELAGSSYSSGSSVSTSRNYGRGRRESYNPSTSYDEAAKRQAELKRQQEEAQRLADKLKAEREQKAQSQTISGQVNIKEDKKGFNESFGTIQNQGINNVPFNAQVYTSPTIEERTTGSFVADGKTIPTTSFFLIEPPKYGSGGGAVKETKVFPSSITPSGAVFFY